MFYVTDIDAHTDVNVRTDSYLLAYMCAHAHQQVQYTQVVMLFLITHKHKTDTQRINNTRE